MDTYKSFAGVYDILMRDIDYNSWYEYLRKIWKKYGARPRIILDLGCGTGTFSVLLSENGYDVIGIDSSPEMLAVAAEKAKEASGGREILFLNQRMENFELYGTVDCIISFFDCINYILKADELSKTFRLAANYLNTGGLFVFDVNTLYKYENILGCNTFAETREDCSYIWNNFYDVKSRINEYELNLFVSNGEGLYEKTTEYHYQRAFGAKTFIRLLKRAGFDILGVFDAYTFNRPHACSERIFFVCRNGLKHNKKKQGDT